METPFLGTKQFGGVKSGFGVGTKIVDEVPQMKPILEAVRGQNGFDDLWSEAVTSSAPQCCQAKLCVHGRAFQQALLRMEKVADKRVVQPGLPLLDEGEFETPKVGATGEKRDCMGPRQIGFDVRANSAGPLPLAPSGHGSVGSTCGCGCTPGQVRDEELTQDRTWVENCGCV